MGRKKAVGSGLTLIVVALLGLYTQWVVGDQLALAFSVAIWSVAVFLAVQLIITLITSLGLAVSRLLIEREHVFQEREITREYQLKNLKSGAEARKIKREANTIVTVAKPGDQVYLTEVNPNTLTRPLHLLPGQVNGMPGQVSPVEQHRWAMHQLAHASTSKPDMVNPEVPPVTVELPTQVALTDLLLNPPSLRRLVLGIGRYPDGQVKPVTAPLSRLVHIATAGSSGFGKSTFMQALAYQVLSAREQPTPVMLDAQGVTFGPFDQHPHLLHPLVSEEDDIERALAGLVGEMDNRKVLLARFRGVVNLRQYNELVPVEKRLPEIPIFFDEFGLVADNKAITGYVRKLVQSGRKFGLYLIAGAQTWLASDISTAIRANLSTSVQFAARDKAQSRVLIGDGAAAKITQPGRAYAILPGQAGLIELQAPNPASVVGALTLPEGQAITQPIPPAPTLKPDDLEATILNYASQGKSKSAIAREVLGSDGGNQLKRVSTILEKFGPVSP